MKEKMMNEFRTSFIENCRSLAKYIDDNGLERPDLVNALGATINREAKVLGSPIEIISCSSQCEEELIFSVIAHDSGLEYHCKWTTFELPEEDAIIMKDLLGPAVCILHKWANYAEQGESIVVPYLANRSMVDYADRQLCKYFELTEKICQKFVAAGFLEFDTDRELVRLYAEELHLEKFEDYLVTGGREKLASMLDDKIRDELGPESANDEAAYNKILNAFEAKIARLLDHTKLPGIAERIGYSGPHNLEMITAVDTWLGRFTADNGEQRRTSGPTENRTPGKDSSAPFDEPSLDNSHVTVNHVAKLLIVGDEAVLRWIHSGALKASNISSSATRPRWRIARADLANFLELRSNQKKQQVNRASKRQKPKRKYV